MHPDRRMIKITSFEKLWLKISGMRVTRIYEIVKDEDDVRIDEYEVHYPQREAVLELERSAKLQYEVFLEKLNQFYLLSWDNFHGAHPKNVLDGDMFSFKATINEKEISAEGSANFPKGYHEFVRWICETLG